MRRFWSDRKANVAVLFAFAIVPVIGAVGAAVDYTLASAYRTDMQKALDATALALSKVVPMEQTQLDALAMKYFQANMGQHDLSNLVLTATPEQGKIVLAVSGDYTPRIANIFGATQFSIGTKAEAVWGMGKVEVVLALDNTGSMSGQKLDQLKLGAQKLIDILKNSAREEGDAKVGIVPFAVQIKVDAASNMNSSWLRTDTTLKVCITKSTGKLTNHMTQSSCESSSSRMWTNVASNNSNWTGCVADRDKDTNLNYDVKDNEPTSTNNTKFPRSLGCGALATVLPLTDVYTASGYQALTNKIGQMQADGNTNVTIGAAWGWHLLDKKAPFTEGVEYQTKDVQKYLILMTDGENTQNRFSTSASQINARTQAVCNNIKAQSPNAANNPSTPAIKVWSIRLISGNEALLKSCATENSMYINVTDPAQLDGIFSAIGAEIASLHLAK